jgi:hypothetical protein
MLENHENPEVGLFLRSLSSSSLWGQLCPEIPNHFETIKGIGLIGLGSLQIEKNHQFLDQKRRPGTVD